MKDENILHQHNESGHAGMAQESEQDLAVTEEGNFSTGDDVNETLPETVSPLKTFEEKFVGPGRPGSWGGR